MFDPRVIVVGDADWPAGIDGPWCLLEERGEWTAFVRCSDLWDDPGDVLDSYGRVLRRLRAREELPSQRSVVVSGLGVAAQVATALATALT